MSRRLLAAGRVLLWGAVALVWVRGALTFFPGATGKPRPAEAQSVQQSFPGDPGRAVAVRFAQEYLTYGKDGHLQKIIDNFNRKMFFTFNNQGLLEGIDGENGKKATYKYNGLLELTESKDVDGLFDLGSNIWSIGPSMSLPSPTWSIPAASTMRAKPAA